MNGISTIIENTIESLDQNALGSLTNHVKSGAFGIPRDVDRVLLLEGRKFYGRNLTETEKKEVRGHLAKMISNARIDGMSDGSFEFQADLPTGGNYKLKSSGAGNIITATIVGGVLVIAGAVVAMTWKK